jgi:hypothetical protein
VYLAGVLEPPPQDPTDRAMHAGLEALGRVQALLMGRLGRKWPADARAAPSARFEQGAIRLFYGEAESPVLELNPIVFDPTPHEIAGANPPGAPSAPV